MVVGQAPGRHEDKQGPLGRAGSPLDADDAVGLSTGLNSALGARIDSDAAAT